MSPQHFELVTGLWNLQMFSRLPSNPLYMHVAAAIVSGWFDPLHRRQVDRIRGTH